MTDTEHFARIDPAFRKERIKRQKTTMVIDGATYVAIAFFAAITAAMGSDEAAKWIAPVWLFWIRTVCAVMGATLLAFKMFRSTSYASHMSKQESDEATDEGATRGTRITTQITQQPPVVTQEIKP